MTDQQPSSKLTFLKKLGLALFNFASTEFPVIAGASQLLLPLLGSGSKAAQVVNTGVNDLTAIGTQVVTIETALQGKTGVEKMQALIPLVGNIVKTSELVVGKKISDESTFIKAIQGFAQAAVDLHNALDPGAVKTA